MSFSRFIRKTVICFLATCLVFVFEFHSFGDEHAFDLFAKACMKSGCSPSLIQSGRAVFDVKKTVGGESQDSIEEKVQIHIKKLQEQFQNSPEQLEVMLTHGVPTYRTFLEGHSFQEQLKIIFRGNDLYFSLDTEQTYRSYENRSYDAQSKKWRDSFKTICYGNPNILDSSLQVRLIPDTGIVQVDKSFINYGEFQMFGRIRGAQASVALGALLPDSRGKEFQLTQAGLSALKQYTVDNAWTFRTSGNEVYDGNSKAVVVEILKNQKVIGRYSGPLSKSICNFLICEYLLLL